VFSCSNRQEAKCGSLLRELALISEDTLNP
jgi:hypothetical protein